MSKSDLITFSVLRKRSGSEREGSSTLNVAQWSRTSVVRQGIEVLAQNSILSPIECGVVSHIRRALQCLNESTKEKLNRSAMQLVENDIVDLLHEFEASFFNTHEITPNTASNYSSAVRRIIALGPDILGDGKSLREVIQEYSPRLRRRNRLPKNELPAELALQSHVDWDDLVRKTHETLLQRQTAIEDAIAKEFTSYEKIIALQEQWLTTSISAETWQLVLEWIESKKKMFKTKPDPTDLAAVLLQQKEQNIPAIGPTGFPQRIYPTCNVATCIEGLTAYQFRTNSAPWFYARDRLPNALLTAIFIAILSYTGWNPGSVGSLTYPDIKPQPRGGYQLQGYKGKTDDDTPIVDVLPSSNLTCKAIALLLWNHHQLKEQGLIPPSESRLWFGWQTDRFVHTTSFSDSPRIKYFCSRHGLEIFKPSELRPLKSALTYIPQRDLEAVRVLLGHKQLLVTDAYLQNTLFFRMNEANMLQFQRRIETSLTYSIGGDDLVAIRKLSPSDVDSALLLPTGDGGACANPYAGSPDEPLAAGEPCSGILCQQGLGCPHYRLMVTDITLEMALRTLRYYRSRWSELHRTNPMAFSRQHIPRLIYIHVLLSIINEQRPDLLQKAEERLA
jgi:integrase